MDSKIQQTFDQERQGLLQRMDTDIDEKFNEEFLDKLKENDHGNNVNGSLVDQRLLQIVTNTRYRCQGLEEVPGQVNK